MSRLDVITAKLEQLRENSPPSVIQLGKDLVAFMNGIGFFSDHFGELYQLALQQRQTIAEMERARAAYFRTIDEQDAEIQDLRAQIQNLEALSTGVTDILGADGVGPPLAAQFREEDRDFSELVRPDPGTIPESVDN